MNKYTIPVVLILLLSICANAQTKLFTANSTRTIISNAPRPGAFHRFPGLHDTTSIDKRGYYTQKSKNQKTAAWVLLAGGTTLIGVGFLIGNRDNSSFEEAGMGFVIGSAGVAACIGSIPLFISARKYKEKASLSIGIQKTYPFVKKRMAAFSLKIPFGQSQVERKKINTKLPSIVARFSGT